jgi:integrase
MGVRKIAGPSPWEARGWESGKQYRRRFRTRKAAEKFELGVHDREERRRNGLPVEQAPITYRELEAKFRSQHETQSKKWHMEMTAYSLEWFGDINVRDLRSEEIGAWVAALPQSPKTKEHILGAMRQILERGVDWGYLTRNPASPRLVKQPKKNPAVVRPFESWAEVEKVADAAGRFRELVIFACATGLRPEEWIALTWADIDLKKGTCRINKVVVDGDLRTERGKTDAAFRVIGLPQRAITALSSLPRPIQSEALVFLAPRGGHIDLDNWRERVWKKALEMAGVTHRPLYQCRHTFATLALAAGADLYWVSKQLGHANISTTLKHYARFLPAVDERNLKLLDEFAA